MLCGAGAGFGLWALFHNRIGKFRIYPETRPGAELVTTGPYGLMRDPMYSALMVMMLGIAAYNGHVLNAVGVALVGVAVIGKAVREERFLDEYFRGYRDYARDTPRFIPYLFQAGRLPRMTRSRPSGHLYAARPQFQH